MKIYKNPWVSRENYFVKTTSNKTFTKGYSIDFWEDKWVVKQSTYYNSVISEMPSVFISQNLEVVLTGGLINIKPCQMVKYYTYNDCHLTKCQCMECRREYWLPRLKREDLQRLQCTIFCWRLILTRFASQLCYNAGWCKLIM